MSLKESLGKQVAAYTSTEFVKVSPESSVLEAAITMRREGSTEALVMSAGRLTGIVTERDILYKVVSEGLDPGKTKVRSVMSAPVETVADTATVADAISKMSKMGIRRLCVTSGGKFIGLVTQWKLVSGRVAAQVPLPVLVRPGYVTCPYCGAQVKESEELSKHINRAHIGAGFFEED